MPLFLKATKSTYPSEDGVKLKEVRLLEGVLIIPF